MVQAGRARRPDIHGRALADGLEALQHLDLVCTVFVGTLRQRCGRRNIRDGWLRRERWHFRLGHLAFVSAFVGRRDGQTRIGMITYV
jgi:hypothetical protein